MARDHARVNVTIWGDPNFRRLPPAAQHLYLTLWTSPELTYVGTHDWRPARLTGRAEGWTRADAETAAACLAARHFIVIDEEREEVLIRSWIRWDGLMKQPRMAISCVNAYAAVASDALKAVIVHQLHAEREREPDLKCWEDPRVQEVLGHPSVDPKAMPTPEDPFGDEVAPGFGVGLGQTQPKVKGSVSVPPTPSPSPSPLLPPSAGEPQTADAVQSPAATAAGFEEFWDAYPRKEAKRKALTAYSAALKRADVRSIVAGAKRYRHDPNRDASYTALPTTWLNGDRWADDPLPPRPGAHPATQAADDANDMWARLKERPA